jgi:hypothetical protein
MPSVSAADPYEDWSDRARQVARDARQQAGMRGHDQVRAEHYLIALIGDDRSHVAALVLRFLEVSVDQLRQRIEEALGSGGPPHDRDIPTSPEVWRAVRAARAEAGLTLSEQVGTEQLLVGIAAEGTSVAARALHELGATPDRLREGVYAVLSLHGCPPGVAPNAVTLPAEIRGIEEELLRLRSRKKAAAEAGDVSGAIALRNEEKVVVARRHHAVVEWAPQVDVARVVKECEILRVEVQRLTRLLLLHGLDAVT